MKRALLLAAAAVLTTAQVWAQAGLGTLQGTVRDGNTKETIPFANVALFEAGQLVTGVTTDLDGNYKIKSLKPGSKYVLQASYVGYSTMEKSGVIVNPDKINFVNFDMTQGINLAEVVKVEHKIPLIDKDGGSVTTVGSEQFTKMAGRTADAVVTTVAGVKDNDGKAGNIKGDRGGGGGYVYIDGVKVYGSQAIPQAMTDQISVMTGGIPAQYGDATGGIISITTKGAAKETMGGIEYVTSQFLDDFGYNLLAANVTGPLIGIKKKDKDGNFIKKPNGKFDKEPIIGYFLAAEGTWIKDANPSAIGAYRVKDEILEDLRANPVQKNPAGGTFLRSEFVRKGDLVKTPAKNNVLSRGIVASGNLDIYTGKNITLKVGGSVDFNDRNVYSYNNSLYNYNNNGYVVNRNWRVFGRFTQRFGNSAPGEENKKASVISNALYSIQADYSKVNQEDGDSRHMDNLFNYGHVGTFKTYRTKTYGLGIDEVTGLLGFLQGPDRDTLVEFIPSTINPDLAAYTAQYYAQNPIAAGLYENLTQIQQDRGALRNGDLPDDVYNLWFNTGRPYNRYAKADQDQFRITASGSFDIKKHSISLGFEYEQRSESFIAYSPAGIWTIMRQYVNNHLANQDLTNPIIQYDEGGNYTDFINYNLSFNPNDDPNLAIGQDQNLIDYNIRQALGLATNGTDIIDVDAYDPSFFNINWFSADELLNNGNSLVNYYGFDHTGNKLSGTPTFDDFFTKTDANGKLTREIAPFRPIYIAGYIQDEFTFKDLIFRLGVRVDRYDANQKVLKDSYSLFETYKAGEVTELGGGAVSHPSNIGSDYVVYVNDLENPTGILGYRNGAVWYNAQGVEVTDPTVIRTGTGIAPYLRDPSNKTITSGAFTDYAPQVNVMPRISFSFPISENSLFYANYDVLTSRPSEGNRLDLLDYLFLANRNETVNNPNLQPETTIEYSVGFKQVIGKNSSLQLNGFYREMRNLIQVQRLQEAYPRTYTTFSNLDFGNVKGLTLTYDMRQTKNISLRLAYTLQFADGTGSNATTGVNVVNAGFPNIRVLQPLDFDQRHNIVATVDYRFGDKQGPSSTSKKSGKTTYWLQNFGVNAVIRAGSGTPYSRQSNVTATSLIDGGSASFLDGSINGSNMPWQFRIDLRADKDFKIKWSKDKEGKPGKSSVLNVYIQVQNLLGTQNVIGVYRKTGNPSDDGYLADAGSQPSIQSQTDEQSFRDLYAIKVNNPNNYSLPRRIRLGIMLNF